MANGGWEIIDEVTGQESVSSPGARLREARERAGLSREAFANELKLPPGRLARLESDDFDAFGPPVFVRGYLRRCAVLLHLPPGEVLELYEAMAGANAAPAEIGLPPGRPPRPDRSGWIGPVLGVLVVATVLAGGWWFFGPSDDAPVAAARRAAPETLAPLTMDAPGAESPLAQGTPPPTPVDEPAAEAVVEAVSDDGAEAADIADAGPAPAAAGEEPPAEATDRVADTVEDALAASPAGAQPGLPLEAPALQARQADIRIQLREDCWLEIIDAEGRRLAYRLGRAGEVTRVKGTAPVSVFLGNAEGVDLTVDGEPIAVRAAARRDGTARLTVGGGAG